MEPFDRIADELLDRRNDTSQGMPSWGLPGTACAGMTNWPPLLCLRVVAIALSLRMDTRGRANASPVKYPEVFDRQ
jgi:hypothetical protein